MNVYARSLLCFVQGGHWLVQLDQIFLLVWDPALNQSYYSYILLAMNCLLLLVCLYFEITCLSGQIRLVHCGRGRGGGGGARLQTVVPRP